MGNIDIIIHGVRYELDDDSASTLMEYLGMNSTVQPKKRFQFAQRVIGASMPAIKSGVKFLADTTSKAQSVEHEHDDHRHPHYVDSFERSKEHQSNKENEYIDRFNEGTEKIFANMNNEDGSHNRYQAYLENHFDRMYNRKQIKKYKRKYDRGE